MIAPCKDCPIRSPTCHVACEAYLEFVRVRAAERTARQTEQGIADAMYATRRRRMNRYLYKQRGRAGFQK